MLLTLLPAIVGAVSWSREGCGNIGEIDRFEVWMLARAMPWDLISEASAFAAFTLSAMFRRRFPCVRHAERQRAKSGDAAFARNLDPVVTAAFDRALEG